MILTAVAILFSSFSSPALSALLTFFVFIIGHFSADLKTFAASMGTTSARYFFGALFYLLPNLSNYSYITPAAHGQTPLAGARLRVARLRRRLHHVSCWPPPRSSSIAATSNDERAEEQHQRRSARGTPAADDSLVSGHLVLGWAAPPDLNRWIEKRRPPVDSAMEEEKLYVTGTAARRMSLSFNGLIADWYWMRSLQYVGRKVNRSRASKVQLDDLAALDLKLLYPLLDTATTLDPQFIAVYEYGGVVLPAINDEDAIKLLKEGIENNPSEWRLFHHLGYIYWQRGDYKTASEIYAEGAKLPGAARMDAGHERAHAGRRRQPRHGARDVHAHLRRVGRSNRSSAWPS